MDEFSETSSVDQPTEPSQKHDLHWAFVGKNGIRAGWSALLFLAIFIALEVLFGLALGRYFRTHMDPKAAIRPRISFLQELCQFALFLIAAGVMAVIEKRKIGAYGYAGTARLQRFIFGLIWGFVAISLLVGSLWKAHLLAFDGSPLHGLLAWEYAAGWGLVFVFVGLFEESLLRGYLQFTLARGIGFWWGALLLSVLFGAIHKGNAGESPVGLFSAGAVGLVFCLSLWYTGSLWWAIGFHAAWDWGQTYFYGTPDSGMIAKGHLLSVHPTGSLLWTGGATGPEGSLLIVPLLILIALLMWLWWGRRTTSPFRHVEVRPVEA
ncbi:CPBP family intramembrane glutamic endopeptidase [Acidobacterium sp. S8]|uniref:CPBP family intramembrane glutamic endopeptidase n=1 Tax=Acidobacterium sp. S8 TaxID=1641854 RepID=UPI00131AA263|nr:CPBP family intramembrane glutamic endopeptidase [Acidobacterium sp. S8]